MLGKHSMDFIIKAGKMGEACRGMAKEIKTKLIHNIRQSKKGQKFLLDNLDGVDYFKRLETVLRESGENRIIINALDWLARLTTHIPGRYEQTVRYYYPLTFVDINNLGSAVIIPGDHVLYLRNFFYHLFEFP